MSGGVDGVGSTHSYSDAEIDALVEQTFRESAQSANRLTAVYVDRVKASNERVDLYTTRAENFQGMASSLNKPEDKYENGRAIDYPQLKADFQSSGVDVPAWVEAGIADAGHQPKKEELEGAAKMYSNKASSEQSAGSLLLTEMNASANEKDTAVRMVSSNIADKHERDNFVVR